jgi:hypothetical protein
MITSHPHGGGALCVQPFQALTCEPVATYHNHLSVVADVAEHWFFQMGILLDPVLLCSRPWQLGNIVQEALSELLERIY